jgi:hypothetical protein
LYYRLLLVPCHPHAATSEWFLWKQPWWFCLIKWSTPVWHLSTDTPTRVRPSRGNLGVYKLLNFDTSFLVWTTFRGKKMEDAIIWLCALGTSHEVSLLVPLSYVIPILVPVVQWKKQVEMIFCELTHLVTSNLDVKASATC